MTAKEQNIGSKEPATKGDLEELREDLQADMVEYFATKEDLNDFKNEIKQELANYATKEDLNDFKNEIKQELTNYATKEDLNDFKNEIKQELTNYATKEDLNDFKNEIKQELTNYATKADLKEELKNYATKADLEAMESRLSSELKLHFDAAVEIMREEFLGAREDEISSMKDKDHQLDERLTAVEKHLGVR